MWLSIFHGSSQGQDRSLQQVDLHAQAGDAEGGADDCNQGGIFDWQGTNVGGSRLERALPLDPVLLLDYQDHGDLSRSRGALYRSTQIQPVHVGEHDGAENEIALVCRKQSQGNSSIAGRHDAKACGF
jgi:hypothetical protein